MVKKRKQTKGDDLLKEVLEAHAADGRGDYVVVTEDTRLNLRAAPGAPALVYSYGHGELEVVAAIFSTHGFVEYMEQQCESIVDEYLRTHRASDKKGRTRMLSDVANKDFRQQVIRALTHLAISHFILGLQQAFSAAFWRHELTSLFSSKAHTHAVLRRVFEGMGLEITGTANLRREMERIVAEVKSEEKAYLSGTLSRAEGKPNFAPLGAHYGRLLPVWQRVKEIYTQNSSLPTWPAMVRAAFPEITFDEDLLMRAAGSFKTFSEKMQASISEKGGDATASSIAIEHAARLCGAKPYQLHARTLFRKIEGSARKVIKTKGVH